MHEARPSLGSSCAVLVVACLWAGFLIGVSFLATPVKFTAPSLSLEVALDVGRQTFRALNRCEIAIGAVLVFLVLCSPAQRIALPFTVAAAAIVLLQTFWLIPALDARVAVILSGSIPSPSYLHTLYVGAEAAKLFALLGVATVALRSILRSSTSVRGASPRSASRWQSTSPGTSSPILGER